MTPERRAAHEAAHDLTCVLCAAGNGPCGWKRTLDALDEAKVALDQAWQDGYAAALRDTAALRRRISKEASA